MFDMRSASSGRRHKPGFFRKHAALAAGLCSAVMGCTTASGPMPNEKVEGFVRRSEDQARLFNSGDIERWLDVADPSEDFTLLAPFGGPANFGFDRSPQHLAALAAAFRNGNGSVELLQAVTSEDIVVLVYIERQEIEVYGLPRQDWSLRVTQVFQRRGPAWKLVHRHADPLVHPLSLAGAAALAAGQSTAQRSKQAS